ncbi:MAG: ATP-binding cassette domain-containing protein [Lachnospiraceae bacterium]|nr:ATP-binding cassette domain-containing protein [Lachnospiraceae bacterium]
MNLEQIKKPVKSGIAKVPMVMQMEAVECGAACLAMILGYYGRWISLEQARDDCGISRDGSSARDILRAGRSYGLEVKGFRQNTESFLKDSEFPCVAHWENNHFIVVTGIKNNKVYINDPSAGAVVRSIAEFNEGYSGVCLYFTPTENFTPGGKRGSVWEYVIKTLKGGVGTIIFSIIITAVMSFSGIANTWFSKFFLDGLLSGKKADQFPSFMTALLCVIAVQVIFSGIRDIYMLKIEGRLSVFGNASYIWKVLRLPMKFFSQRSAGDIQQRQSLNANVARELTFKIAPVFLNFCMLIFYLVVMLRFSVMLTMVGLIGMLINTLIGNMSSKRNVNLTQVLMRDEGLLDSATVSGVNMIETLKSSGSENGFFQLWASYHDSVNDLKLRVSSVDASFTAFMGMVTELVNYTVIFIGAFLIYKGHFTEGTLFAFRGYLDSFITPVDMLISAGQDLQEMRTRIDRIKDVMEYPTDKACVNMEDISTDGLLIDSKDKKDKSDYSKLKGTLSIKNVTFGYSKFAKPLINDFSLELKTGSSVAFVGPSGCGKSTLANLISGLYQPWSGEILFDGKHIDEIDQSVFRSSVTVVDQDITIFEDTIANNIKMWDNTIEDFEMILAAKDASIHEDIMKREGGYENILIENGRNMSGGQRQRLEIARVLASDPIIVVLDEATSALDARTEYNVMKSIRDRGITTVIIAHRLSTIRDCDEIIVLDQGEVMQRGTHEQLMKEGGLYKLLVSSE